MRMSLRRAACVMASLLLAAMLGPLAAKADTLKNRETGEVIKGTLTNQKVNGKTVVELISGEKVFLNLEEWEIEKRPEKDRLAPAESSAASLANTSIPKVYVFPITGAIEDYALVEALQQGLAEAKGKRVALVILLMDTPGGRVDITDKIAQEIQNVDWAPVVSLVAGGDNRALSAGAYICLTTKKIYMAKGCTIGAATPYSIQNKTGTPEIDAKFASAFRARFRSLAQANGFPSAIVDAMVDNKISVVQVFVDNKPMLVAEEEAKRLALEHKADGRFRRGKVVNKPGELITLTTEEALDLGLCAGVARNAEEVARKMGLPSSQISQDAKVPEFVARLTKQRKAVVDSLISKFVTAMAKADTFYQLAASSRSSAEFVRTVDQCMNQIKEARQALVALEKLTEDRKYDIADPTNVLAKRKMELDSITARLAVLRKNR